MKTKSNTSPMTRLLITLPAELIRLIGGCVPAGQSRAEWIREAIRQRILRDGQPEIAVNPKPRRTI